LANRCADPSRRFILGFPRGRNGKPDDDPTPHDVPLKYAINSAMLCGVTSSVDDLIQAATDARRIAQKAIELAVREARAADWSWDQISAALGGKPNGETLRRNFSSDE
jgi:hypothetical protein